MFFEGSKQHFFKPLVGKYREHISQCLCLLYSRQFGSNADYGHALTRQQVVEIFEEALIQVGDVSNLAYASNPESLDENPDQAEERFKNPREQASWVLKQLIEFGWIERQVDPGLLQSTYPFSRVGRVFSQKLLESESKQFQTHHRNTRNTLNALDAFATRGEVYDLLDAFDYSERIVTDFTDVVAELEEKKRALVQEMESQQLVQRAADQFFEYMEKRFQPDIQVRLSADSVEKHREDINKRIHSIRRKPKAFKANAERELRRLTPDLCQTHQSYLLFILEMIERRMQHAADTMLPALRSALHGFTKRADIIIRQMSFLSTQGDSDLVEICRELADLSPQDAKYRYANAAEAVAGFKLHLIDPKQIKLSERKAKQTVDSRIEQIQAPDKEAQRELMIQAMLDQAFVLNNQGIRDYVIETLKGGHKLNTRELAIHDAQSLIAAAHAIEVASANNLSSNHKFKVTCVNRSAKRPNEYYQAFDEHEIELIETHATVENT